MVQRPEQQQIRYQIIRSGTADFYRFTPVQEPYQDIQEAITAADLHQWRSDHDDYGNAYDTIYRVVEKDSNTIVYQTISKPPYSIFRYTIEDLNSRIVCNTDGSLSPQVYVKGKWYYLSTKERRYITGTTLLECEEAIREHYQEAKLLLR